MTPFDLAPWLLLLLLAIYFVPSFIAASRRAKRSNAVFFLNLLAGWTVVGWIVAFIWAVADNTANDGRIPCPFCAERIMPEAKVCPHCQRELAPIAAQAGVPPATL
jgi:hypothetical protein